MKHIARQSLEIVFNILLPLFLIVWMPIAVVLFNAWELFRYLLGAHGEIPHSTKHVACTSTILAIFAIFRLVEAYGILPVALFALAFAGWSLLMVKLFKILDMDKIQDIDDK
jgi:hypothetical protein